MIAAFARTARVLAVSSDDGRALADPYLKAARRAAAFVRERMWSADSRRLLRRYRNGHADIDAYAEDYACLIFGLLELFQADPDPMWLEWAIALQHRQDELFWDEAGAGWFSTTGRDPSVLLRMKEDYDGAEPTASSMAVMNLLMLSHLVDEVSESHVEPVWTERIERTLGAFRERLEQLGRGVPMMAAALSTYVAGVQQIVVVEGPGGSRRAGRAGRVGTGARPPIPAIRDSTPPHERATAPAERKPAVHRGDGARGRENIGVRVSRSDLPRAGDRGRRP